MGVAFYTRNRDGEHRLGEVQLMNGEVLYRNLPPRLVEELALGVFDGPTRVQPTEGQRFLDALPRAYAGTYMFARAE